MSWRMLCCMFAAMPLGAVTTVSSSSTPPIRLSQLPLVMNSMAWFSTAPGSTSVPTSGPLTYPMPPTVATTFVE